MVKQGIEGISGTFWSDTSLHGVKHVSDASRGKRRFFWIFAFVAMVLLLVVIVVNQVVKIYSYPFYTVSTLHQRHNMSFPAVTICNNNQFRDSHLDKDMILRKVLQLLYDHGPLVEEIDLTDPFFVRRQKEHNKMNKNSSSTACDPSALFRDSAHQLDHMFQFCSWKGQEVNCSEYFRPRQTNYGYCYTFNSQEFINDQGVLEVNCPGDRGGLMVVLDIEEHEYSYSMGSSTGIKVLVHEPASEPTVRNDGFLAGPGMMTYAAVSLTKISALPLPYMAMGDDYCLDTGASGFVNPLEQYDTYDIKACFMECQAKVAIQKCGCRDLFVKGEVSFCSLAELVGCYNPAKENVINDAEELHKCGCKRQCQWSRFDTTISTAGFPLPRTMKQIMKTRNVTKDYIRANYLGLAVFFDKLIYNSVEQVGAYGIEDIVANLGGQLGIFIGASFLTLTEVLEYLIGVAWVFVAKPRKTAVKAWVAEKQKPEDDQLKTASVGKC